MGCGPSWQWAPQENKVLSLAPQTIIHTERSRKNLARQFMYFVFVEHLLLAKCDYLVLSESGYGATAAAWGHVEGSFHGPTCTSFLDVISEIEAKRVRNT